ncbi:antibiotic biosynthesis monooxygenase family protein [Thermostaphylospora chromogena]|uniref:Heme-degrading monooxygenase HmoA n=1 Tax=Thermostaphylospora chromogena TaxID=35622 RepID=A0A1H1FQ79_9ACTN|nr:antibiotic biosynthesis monooxygenase [Thermostaphylospora chromogena]SDR03071.1 Heme-degrading monooxygenase HmoA [Thermostaphylospora chromogena]
MIAMIFEYWFDPDDEATYREYLAESAELRKALPALDGFLGVERYASDTEPGKYLAVGFFRDEEAVAAWRAHPAHRRAQALGRRRFFTRYRLRMAEVVRDYGMDDRAQAPADSRRFHDREPAAPAPGGVAASERRR